MALEYRLTVAGSGARDAIAHRAFPPSADGQPPMIRPFRDTLSIDLHDTQAVQATILTRHDVHLEAVGDGGEPFEQDLAVAVAIVVSVNKEAQEKGVRSMAELVQRILATGNEDVALVFNHDYLLLTRQDGVIRKFRRAMFWDEAPEADAAIRSTPPPA